MGTGTTPRYAIYYAPEVGGPLDHFGRTWFEPASAARMLAGSGLDSKHIADLSESARR